MFLIWILIVLLVIRLIFRWILPMILPYLLKRFLKRHGQNAEMFNDVRSNHDNNTEKFSGTKPAVSKNEDEYIDFEEL